MRSAKISISIVASLLLGRPAGAFYEDVCVSTTNGQFESCYANDHGAGRSLIHVDSTYFIALALGYRADVAYWLAAYNEVTDFGTYAPMDQCGKSASSTNSGASYLAATYNGFVRNEGATGGFAYHYSLGFSPQGDASDIFYPGGTRGVYTFRFPSPGYPGGVIDNVYEPLSELRQWGMLAAASDPGFLCTVGFTLPSTTNSTTAGVPSYFGGSTCQPTTVQGAGVVPYLGVAGAGQQVQFSLGPMTLDLLANGTKVPYTQLAAYLADPTKTTGTLWLDPSHPTVPVQVARVAHYLHALQDRSSHGTYCGDDAPHENSVNDSGSYIATAGTNFAFNYGETCAQQYHLQSHVQETGTGAAALPLRVYTALNMTLNELIVFGNSVALPSGWIANKELLPANASGALNGQGRSAADLANEVVGTIVKGKAYTGAEQYASGVATLPLQQTAQAQRLAAMNAALVSYGSTVKGRSANPGAFVPFTLMPGNAASATDTSVCWK